MHKFLGPLWPFVSMITIIGLPSGSVLIPGIVALTAFVGLSAIAQDLAEAQRFALAFIFGMSVKVFHYLPDTYAQLTQILGRKGNILATLAVLGHAVAMLTFHETPHLLQHMVTVIALAPACLYLTELALRDFNGTDLLLPPNMRATMSPTMAWVMVGASVSFALLNATLVQLVSLPVWLVCWALYPVVAYIVTEGLIVSVMIAHSHATEHD